MATNYKSVMRRLQLAINDKFTARILVNKQQFYSMEAEKPITTYVIKQTLYDAESGKKTYVELFSSCSEIQCVLWLRDYWYELNGWEVPTDNPIWLEEKQKYYDKITKSERGRKKRQ